MRNVSDTIDRHAPIGFYYLAEDFRIRTTATRCRRISSFFFDRLEESHRANPVADPVAVVKFNWHTLFSAGLGGTNAQDRADIAGHSSLQVTMAGYGHLFKSDDHKAAMDVIAKAF